MKKENKLKTFFDNNSQGRLISKWNHYFDIYERHFNEFRGKQIVILEIGVSNGGSLHMWKHYFGDGAMIFGVDVIPECKSLEQENIKIFIGSQSDRKFLRNLKESIPPIDILIDDGGHTMIQQKRTFEELFDHVKEDGIYLCEDLHTSYLASYGDGYKRKGSFIEYSKNFIDYLNAFHSEQRAFKVNSFTKSVDSIHYYDSIIVIEKRKKKKPYDTLSGNISLDLKTKKKTFFQKISLTILNLALRFLILPGITRR
jgi:23S rRNA U2552 (ribose-2'-O)-methylase RlmE/FtsJ